MKLSTALYLVLGIAGLSAAVLVPWVIYSSGTPVLPVWRAIASPGPLSAAHAFLNTECESCHTPNQGIAAASCIKCHASEPLLLGKQSTVFHASVQECRGCHIEHQSAAVRPIRMDHSVLIAAGLRAAPAVAPLGRPDTPGGGITRHFRDRVMGNLSPAHDQMLDCMACHGFRDKHAGLFGQQCADCHMTTTWKIEGYLHPSPKSRECLQCHQAPPSHFMMHFAMMDQGITGEHNASVEQCFSCHQTDSFNNIKGVGWFKIH